MDVLLMATTGVLTVYLPRRILLLRADQQTPMKQQRSISRTGLIPTTTLSLGLSLTLFTLSIVELLPGSWLWFLSTDLTVKEDDSDDAVSTLHKQHISDPNTNSSVMNAYCIVFWSLSFLCTVVIPSIVGTRVCWQMTAPHSHSSTTTVTPTTPVATDAGDTVTTTSNSNNGVVLQHTDPEDEKKRHFSAHLERHWTTRLACSGLSVLINALSYLLAPCRRQLRIYCRQLRDDMTLPMFATNRNGRTQSPRWLCFISRTHLFHHRFFYDAAYRRCVLIGSVTGTAITCILLASVSPLVIEPSTTTTLMDELRFHQNLLLQRVISWLCSVGIILSTVLNGFGSILLPYSCLAGLFLDPIPRDCVANAEMELVKAKETLNDKRKTIETGFIIPSVQLGATRQKSSTLNRFLWKNVSRNLNDIGDEVSRRKRMLRSEIDFLETLIEEMSDDVDEMKASQALSTEARSSAGRIRSWIGIVCSVVLLLRLAWAMSSVWNQYTWGVTMYRSVKVDPVTQLTVWLSGHRAVSMADQHTLSQFTSLVITAVLSVSQVRTFFQTCNTVQRRVTSVYRKCYCKPRCRISRVVDDDVDTATNNNAQVADDSEDPIDTSRNHHTWFWSQIVSVLMCCYCLACVVLTKMMLPFEYRASFTQAIQAGSMEGDLFKIRTFVIDATFSLTALFTGGVLAVILGIMRTNARRYRSSESNSGSPSKSPMSQAMVEP